MAPPQALSNTMQGRPWTVLGDFNVVRKAVEMKGGALNWPSYMEELNDCCRDSLLEDLRFSRCHLTWRKRGTGDNALIKKLDRALSNHQWLFDLSESEETFLDPGSSDHSPIVITTGIHLHVRKPPFRFFNFWCDHDSFEELVQLAWNEPVWGSAQYSLSLKLKRLKAALKVFNRQCFSNLHNTSDQARLNLIQIQNLLQSDLGNQYLLSKESSALKDLEAFSSAEESMIRQKAIMLWIKGGDGNTKYFHSCLKNRFKSNKILSLSLEDGRRLFNPAEIQSSAIRFFHNLFTKPLNSAAALTDISSFVRKRIPIESAQDLIRPVTSEEIKETIFRMKPDKAPGPDGYNAFFFQKMWHIVGEDVVAAVRSFFHSGSLFKELNHTAITLVPKVPNASSMKDYRPIACCNLIYNCIRSILARRLQKVLPYLIDKAQTAFVPGWSISDNILLA